METFIKRATTPITNTWVFIDFANKIKHGSVKPIKLMNRDLVLWRTQSGKISLLNAYCPHMGAHLGYGKIRGELLECSFHKKCFTPEGRCQGLGKSTRSYPISLNNNMLFAWFGEEQPVWQMPDILKGFPGKPDSTWKIFRFRKLNFNFLPKSVLENAADATHFKTFHQQCNSYEAVKILEASKERFTTHIKLAGRPLLSKLGIPVNLELSSP